MDLISVLPIYGYNQENTKDKNYNKMTLYHKSQNQPIANNAMFSNKLGLHVGCTCTSMKTELRIWRMVEGANIQ